MKTDEGLIVCKSADSSRKTKSRTRRRMIMIKRLSVKEETNKDDTDDEKEAHRREYCK